MGELRAARIGQADLEMKVPKIHHAGTEYAEISPTVIARSKATKQSRSGEASRRGDCVAPLATTGVLLFAPLSLYGENLIYPSMGKI
jgi:hypothetical protein